MAKYRIIYTLTDEAPALATHSWLPIVQAYTGAAGITVAVKDISLAARTLAQFPHCLAPEQRIPDALEELRRLVQQPAANIIKLPNISASLPQLKSAIKELQEQGYKVPDYSANEESYQRVLGSAVNPVIREGNSDRRVAHAVKNYARKHPHSMGAWRRESRSHVASMQEGDFYDNERSRVMKEAGNVSIQWQGKQGEVPVRQVLKAKLPLLAGEIVDASVMSCRALREYFQREIPLAKEQGVLLSLHLKATMMKVSDPIIFGHGLEVFYGEVFDQYQQQFNELGIDPRHGLGDLYSKLQALSPNEQGAIRAAIARVEAAQPPLAMVDSDRGITNFHFPNDIIVDASMPAAIRNAGQMWGPDGQPRDTKALIPDRCYGGIYQVVMDYCRQHGAFDVSSMGSVSNIGLMAKQAEEYGSHDQTFEVPGPGVVQVISQENGEVLFEHKVSRGDIWRMCQTKAQAIEDWVQLALKRARATGNPALFWLDPKRAHDANLVPLVEQALAREETTGLDISLMAPTEAMQLTLERMSQGLDTIAVTGNVLRDYLTDLFPILELGTSAKMLSIVPLLEGGSLYETGAGGSAPKHMQQFIQENHLRWDSLGEFLALAVSLEDLATKTNDPKVWDLAKALNKANERFLQMNKSPSRKTGEIDTRGSHFYLALYWAQFLSQAAKDAGLKKNFALLHRKLQEAEESITRNLLKVQGKPVDIGGYYRPDPIRTARAMRPSSLFNTLTESI